MYILLIQDSRMKNLLGEKGMRLAGVYLHVKYST